MEGKLKLRTRQVGPWAVNAYALICPASGESVLIDPGADPDALADMLADSKPIAILLTHTHFDHIGALDELRERLSVPVMAHPGPWPAGAQVDIDRELNHGDLIRVGTHNLKVYRTPGHTPDQICIAVEGDHHIIVGDTLFEGGPGKTWSPEDFQTTLKTLRRVILLWPDKTRCYPGHGNSFRLGDIRNDIQSFLDKNHGDFCGDATWTM
jgi:hydroxyacylglutathione hydrolase